MHSIKQTVLIRYRQAVLLLMRPFVQRLLLLGLGALVATCIGCSVLLPHAIHDPGMSPVAFIVLSMHLLERRSK